MLHVVLFLLSHRLVSLVVRRPLRQRKIPGSNPACAGICVCACVRACGGCVCVQSYFLSSHTCHVDITRIMLHLWHTHTQRKICYSYRCDITWVMLHLWHTPIKTSLTHAHCQRCLYGCVPEMSLWVYTRDVFMGVWQRCLYGCVPEMSLWCVSEMSLWV